MFRFFLSQGANPDAKNSDGLTLLAMESKYDELETMEILLDRGVRVDGHDGEEGARPLPIACRYGGYNAVDTVELLVDRGADVNAIDADGETPLLSVLNFEQRSFFRHAEIIRLLLDRGAAVNARESKTTKETALHRASRIHNVTIAKMLLGCRRWSEGYCPSLTRSWCRCGS